MLSCTRFSVSSLNGLSTNTCTPGIPYGFVVVGFNHFLMPPFPVTSACMDTDSPKKIM